MFVADRRLRYWALAPQPPDRSRSVPQGGGNNNPTNQKRGEPANAGDDGKNFRGMTFEVRT